MFRTYSTGLVLTAFLATPLGALCCEWFCSTEHGHHEMAAQHIACSHPALTALTTVAEHGACDHGVAPTTPAKAKFAPGQVVGPVIMHWPAARAKDTIPNFSFVTPRPGAPPGAQASASLRI